MAIYFKEENFRPLIIFVSAAVHFDTSSAPNKFPKYEKRLLNVGDRTLIRR